MDFVRQLSWKNEGLTDQFLNFDNVCDLEEESWEAEIRRDDLTSSGDPESTTPTNSATILPSSSIDPTLCVFCKKNKKELCLIPCGHTSCSSCWNVRVDNMQPSHSIRLRSKSKTCESKCPHDGCNQNVLQTIRLQF